MNGGKKPNMSWNTAIAPHVVSGTTSQMGFHSKQGIVKQARRGYSKDREIQLMRQVSTRLFYHAQARAKKKGMESPVEVEMMYSGGNVFIGSNKQDTAESIMKALSDSNLTRKALVDQSYFKSDKSTGGRITSRHAKKLESRVFDSKKQAKWLNTANKTEAASRKRAAYIGTLVKDQPPQYIDPTDKKAAKRAFKTTSNVYIIDSSGKGQEGRHVEEKFMDILEKAKHTGTSYVGGKMRPCLTCTGRMGHLSDQGHDVHYNPRPGKIWKSRYEAQPHDVQLSTAKRVKTSKTYGSKAGWGYGSESDSDMD